MERSCNECRALRLIEGHEVNSGTQFNVFAQEFGIWVMCNLYSITTNQEAISRLFRVDEPLCRLPRADALQAALAIWLWKGR